MIRGNPIFGIGSGRWNTAKNKFGSKDKNIMDSHNDLLAMMSQFGIISGIFFSACVYFLPLFIYRTKGIRKKVKIEMKIICLLSVWL